MMVRVVDGFFDDVPFPPKTSRRCRRRDRVNDFNKGGAAESFASIGGDDGKKPLVAVSKPTPILRWCISGAGCDKSWTAVKTINVAWKVMQSV
jgi:hypothetical protein